MHSLECSRWSVKTVPRMEEKAILQMSSLGFASLHTAPGCHLSRVPLAMVAGVAEGSWGCEATPATFETPEVHTGTGVVGSKPRPRGQGLEDGE